MRLHVLTLCAGIAAHSQMPVIAINSAWLTGAISAAACLLAVLLSALSRRTLADNPISEVSETACLSAHAGKRVCVVLLLFVGGFCWAMLTAQLQLAQRLPYELEGVDFWLTGRVEGLVRREPTASVTESVTTTAATPATTTKTTAEGRANNRRSQQFDLRVQSSCFRLLPDTCTAQNISQILSGQRVTLNDYAALPVQSGQWWRLRVRLNRPHGFANPGSYDFEAGQFQRGIMARGYVRETTFNTQLAPPPGFIARIATQLNISRIRAALVTAIEQVPDITNAGLLNALVVGDRSGISDSQWDLFTATGTNHLVVISGLHVGFVALSVWTLINWLSRAFPWLLLHVPAQHLAGVAAIIAAACYSMLAGLSLPTQRALIMILVLMSSRLSGRQTAPADSLSLAALLVLLLDPMAVTQAGFWLSFIAVSALFFAFQGYSKPAFAAKPSRAEQLWQRWGQPQWVVSVGLLLPLIMWTGQTSLNAPLANVFAIPLVSLLVVPMALIGSMMLSVEWVLLNQLAVLLLQLADRLLDWLQYLLVRVTDLSVGLWRPPVPSLLTMVLAAVSCLLLLMPRGVAPRWLALPLLLPLIWPLPAARPLPGRVWLQFLDAGQGLAIVVHTRRHDLLFDTGPALGPDYDAGQAVIVPYLHFSRVQQLDGLIVSHWHADHSGGLDSVLDQFVVTRALSGHAAPKPRTPDPTRTQFERCQAGQHWQWDEVHFRVLYPPAGSMPLSGNINNSSCVLLIEAAGQRVLLTGDIEAVAERWLLDNYGDQLRVDVLQAPHHGSRSSSSAAFVQATAARWVVMSAGYRNRFGHPHAEVVERYQQYGAQVLVTAEHGAIGVELGGEDAAILSRHRQQQRRFWFNLSEVTPEQVMVK